MPIDNYLVFYLPVESRKTVAVIRIMYSGRNIDEAPLLLHSGIRAPQARRGQNLSRDKVFVIIHIITSALIIRLKQLPDGDQKN